MPRPGGLIDKVNSIGNSALYCSKKFEGNSQLYPAKGKVTNTKSKHGLSGRCPGAVNINIGPVRIKSQLSFNKNWREYEEGFGDLNKDFWAGLELIHTVTQRGQWEMRVDYQRNDKTWSYYHYNQFSVGSASKEYPLTVGGFTGVGDDRFAYHNGMKISTPDNDNDNYGDNCAASLKSGWWYKGCNHININRQPPNVYGYGSVLFIEMKIRPKDCITQ